MISGGGRLCPAWKAVLCFLVCISAVSACCAQTRPSRCRASFSSFGQLPGSFLGLVDVSFLQHVLLSLFLPSFLGYLLVALSDHLWYEEIRCSKITLVVVACCKFYPFFFIFIFKI